MYDDTAIDMMNIAPNDLGGYGASSFKRRTVSEARGVHFIEGQLKRMENYTNRAKIIASIMSPSGKINFYRQPKIKPHKLSQYIGARPLSSNDMLSTADAVNDFSE